MLPLATHLRQVRLQDPDEDPAGGEEVRGGEADRDQGDDAGPVRDPGPVHLEHARLDPGPEPAVIGTLGTFLYTNADYILIIIL